MILISGNIWFIYELNLNKKTYRLDGELILSVKYGDGVEEALVEKTFVAAPLLKGA